VPIGAGLKDVKKEKKKAGKYVEPGSGRGCLLTVLFGLGAFGCFKYQPWQDDWELVRGWFGKGRHHSVVGEWQIVKTLLTRRDKPAVLGQVGIKTGSINFSKTGSVKMVFNATSNKSTASGAYQVNAVTLGISNLKPSSPNIHLPKTLVMQLAWTGPDMMVATVGSEAVYLRRKEEKTPIAKLMKFGLSKGKEGEAPGQFGSIVDNLSNQLKAAETEPGAGDTGGEQ